LQFIWDELPSKATHKCVLGFTGDFRLMLLRQTADISTTDVKHSKRCCSLITHQLCLSVVTVKVTQ